MFYYIKKSWKLTSVIVLMLFIGAGLVSYRSLALMRSLERLLDGDFRGFLFWCLLNVSLVILAQLIEAAEDVLGGHLIRQMNNRLRCDMGATLLQMSYGEFHKKQTGEYLSGFTKDIDQIQNLAWTPFFDWLSMAFRIIHSMIALSCLH